MNNFEQEPLSEAQQTLRTLAEGAIERLKELPQPVVRVSGPIASGGYGYEENMRRFIAAQQKLREQGYTVFDYFEDNDDEEVIKELDVPWEEVMRHYHDPILKTGFITTVFMMPNWQDSNGAKWEHQHFLDNELEVAMVPEEWLSA